MSKNIIIGILVVLCITLFFFGLTQRTAADKFQTEAAHNFELAEQNALLARKNAEEAQIQVKIADANAKEAHHQLLIAEQNLLECSQKKKSRKQ